MNEVDVLLSVFGVSILLLSLSVGLLKGKSYLPTQPLVAVALGVLIGPDVLGWIHLSSWGDPTSILEEVARLTIAFSVMAAALRIPRTYFGDQPEAMASLLSVGQVAMALVSGLLAYWLLGIPFWLGMLVGAIVTPTDPVISSTIVHGETATNNIPARLRHLLSGESGANDGGAYPFVFLSILMIEHPVGEALSRWGSHTLLWDVGFAVLAGLAIGATAGWLQRWALENDVLNETPLTTVTVSLALLALGVVHLLGSDGILAVFVAGLAFNRVAPGDPETEQEAATDTVERLFTIPVFVLFGSVLPWGEWVSLGWMGVALVVGVLLFRRLPMVFAIRKLVPPIERSADAALAGWFGPIGVAAIFYAILAYHELGTQEPWVVGSLIVAGSVLAYGVTTTVGTHHYGERTGYFQRETGRPSSQQGRRRARGQGAGDSD